MARSFTVPWTAIEPMSPPGKKTGRTTYESVVNASFLPVHSTTAESCCISSSGLRNAARNIRLMSWCISFPPPPCAINTCGYCEMGMGQEPVKSGKSLRMVDYWQSSMTRASGFFLVVVLVLDKIEEEDENEDD